MVNSTTVCNTVSQSSRLHDAYAAGDRARDTGCISATSHTIYEWLVEYAKSHGVAWPAEETLAQRLGKSVTTIKRCMAQLRKAALIVRKPRGLGLTALTYIAVWMAGGSQSLFFDGRDGPSEGPQMVPLINSINLPDLKEAGGGGAEVRTQPYVEERETPPPPMPPPPSPAAEALRAAGLVDERTIAALAAKPLSTIRQAVTYVAAQRKGPGLIAYLLGNDIAIPHARALRKEHIHGRPDATPQRDRRRAGRDEPCPWDGSGVSIIINGDVDEFE